MPGKIGEITQFDQKIFQDGWLKRTANFQLLENLCFIFFAGKSVVVFSGTALR